MQSLYNLEPARRSVGYLDLSKKSCPTDLDLSVAAPKMVQSTEQRARFPDRLRIQRVRKLLSSRLYLDPPDTDVTSTCLLPRVSRPAAEKNNGARHISRLLSIRQHRGRTVIITPTSISRIDLDRERGSRNKRQSTAVETRVE